MQLTATAIKILYIFLPGIIGIVYLKFTKNEFFRNKSELSFLSFIFAMSTISYMSCDFVYYWVINLEKFKKFFLKDSYISFHLKTMFAFFIIMFIGSILVKKIKFFKEKTENIIFIVLSLYLAFTLPYIYANNIEALNPKNNLLTLVLNNKEFKANHIYLLVAMLIALFITALLDALTANLNKLFKIHWTFFLPSKEEKELLKELKSKIRTIRSYKHGVIYEGEIVSSNLDENNSLQIFLKNVCIYNLKGKLKKKDIKYIELLLEYGTYHIEYGDK